MKVFHYDNHFGDLWALRIDEAAENVEKAIRVAEGEEIEGFPSISTGFVDAALSLEILAVLTDTEAFLIEVDSNPNFDDWSRRFIDVAPSADDRESVSRLLQIVRGNYSRIKASR